VGETERKADMGLGCERKSRTPSSPMHAAITSRTASDVAIVAVIDGNSDVMITRQCLLRRNESPALGVALTGGPKAIMTPGKSTRVRWCGGQRRSAGCAGQSEAAQGHAH
jgi:hypothetical protein